MSEEIIDINQVNKKFKKRKCLSIIGIIIMLFTLFSMCLFGFFIYRMHIIPTKYLIIVGVVFALLFALTAFLCSNCRKRVRFIIGILLGILITAAMLLGSYIVAKTMNTITGGMSAGSDTQISHMGVYVRKDDSATDLDDISDYQFGILSDAGMLSSFDKENTTKTINHLNDELKTEINISEYDSIMELLDSLLEGKVGAIIINKSYLDIDMFTDTVAQMREITNLEIENKVEKPSKNNDKTTEKDDTPEIFTIYLSGIDSRVGLIEKSRSDVNILATVNTKTKQILLVSTPRDYYVPLSFTNGQRDKLTHAGIYGVDVSMDTVGMLYDTDVDYFFRVNFSGFEQIIDSIGGITVFSDYDFYSAVSHIEVGKYYHYTYGENELDGEAALYFARERKSFPTGDRQRGENQMKVIKAVADKIISPQILTKYTSLLDAIEGCFETSIPYDLISSIVKDQLDDGGEWNIVSYSVNGTGANEQPYSLGGLYASVMIPDEATVETAKDLIKQVKDGKEISLTEEP